MDDLVRLKTEDKFVFTTLSKSSLSILIRRLSFLIPALFTRTSIFPKSDITSSTNFEESSKLEASLL